jgi:hypothetical protein
MPENSDSSKIVVLKAVRLGGLYIMMSGGLL